MSGSATSYGIFPDEALYTAIHARLDGSILVDGSPIEVCLELTGGQGFPVVVLGDFSVEFDQAKGPFGGICDVRHTSYVYSARGISEVSAIRNQITIALRDPFDLSAAGMADLSGAVIEGGQVRAGELSAGRKVRQGTVVHQWTIQTEL